MIYHNLFKCENFLGRLLCQFRVCELLFLSLRFWCLRFFFHNFRCWLMHWKRPQTHEYQMGLSHELANSHSIHVRHLLWGEKQIRNAKPTIPIKLLDGSDDAIIEVFLFMCHANSYRRCSPPLIFGGRKHNSSDSVE